MKKNLSKAIGVVAIAGIMGTTGVIAFASYNNIDRETRSNETIIIDKEQLEQIIIDDNLEVPEGYELVEVIQG